MKIHKIFKNKIKTNKQKTKKQNNNSNKQNLFLTGQKKNNVRNFDIDAYVMTTDKQLT